jgi:hypothetical protein
MTQSVMVESVTKIMELAIENEQLRKQVAELQAFKDTTLGALSVAVNGTDVPGDEMHAWAVLTEMVTKVQP